MTTLAVQDIPASIKCAGTVNCTIPAGLSTYFQNATYLLFGCWVKPTTTFNGADWRDFLIFRGDSGTSVFAGLFVNNVSNQFAVAGLGAGSGVYNANLNVWSHVVGEIDVANSKLYMWVNGVLVMDYAATLTRNLATVTLSSSYIGDSASPGFDGHIAQPFIQNRTTKTTQDEIDAIFKKGMLPSAVHTFQWPMEAAAGTTLPCLDSNENSSPIHLPFNGVLNSSTMWSRDTPMTGRFVDRDGGSCVMFSGAAGYYRNNTDRLYNELNGARCVGMSIWAQMKGPVNSGISRCLAQILTDAGNAGLIIQVDTVGNMVMGGRASSADAFQGVSVPATGFYPKIGPNEWHKYDVFIDYTAKYIYGYVDGMLFAQNLVATFANDTFQVIRGAQEAWLAANTSFWPGKLDDMCIFRSDSLPTHRQMRQWYLQNQLPPQLVPKLILDCNDFGPNLIDKSGNGIDFTPIGVAAPYGLHPLSYTP